jgi:hypothetical protein
MRLLLLRGRSERRIPVGIPVYLARASLPQEKELAIATDVGEHGLRASTSRYWRPGEVLQISPLSDNSPITAKVAYCWRRFEHTYHTGLELENPEPNWWKKF